MPMLGVIAFWTGLAVAARRFPGEFDWRYMTVSNLLSESRNPRGHLWATSGLALCGLGGWVWTLLRVERPRATSPGARGTYWST